jgi:hypothetical protein
VKIGPQILINMWASDQNEMMFSTSNRKILYLTMQMVCRNNLSQSDQTDCKVITIEEEEKVFGVEPGLLSMF